MLCVTADVFRLAESGGSGNPYVIAGFALAGAVLGAAVSAITQAVIAVRQTRVASRQALRDERRTLYAKFMLELEMISQDAGRHREYRESDPLRPSAADLEGAIRNLWGTETLVVLIAGKQVRGLLREAVEIAADGVIHALSKEPDPDKKKRYDNRERLLAAMRRDLGIADSE